MKLNKISKCLLVFPLVFSVAAPAPKGMQYAMIAPASLLAEAVPQQPVHPKAHLVVKEPLKVVLVSPEADPFSKAGGMGDYLLGLSNALRGEGQIPMVISPLYERYKGDYKWDDFHQKWVRVKNKRADLIEKYNIEHFALIPVDIGEQEIWIEVKTTELNGVKHYFLVHDYLFDRLYKENVIGNEPGASRTEWLMAAVALSRGALAVLEYLQATNKEFHPDIIHTNDWMAALIPVFLKTDPRYQHFLKKRMTEEGKEKEGIKTLHTIHNNGSAYQGLFPAYENGRDLFSLLNIGGEHFFGFKFFDGINLTAAAVAWHADRVMTVSKGFRDETLENSDGLEEHLRMIGDDYVGIVNGTDLGKWNRLLDQRGGGIKGKEKAKQELIKKAGLDTKKDGPIMGMVTRIVEQKGMALLLDDKKDGKTLLERVIENNPSMRFVFLGSGEEEWENELARLNHRFPGRVSVTIAFIPELADLIYLGSDFFLMPSRYEPCGIAQLEAMACRTVPIVTPTGGLDDTVEDFDPYTGQGSGIKMKAYDAVSLAKAVAKAVELYQEKGLWQLLMANAYRQATQYTWPKTAQDTTRLYRRMRNELDVLPIDLIEKPSKFLYEKPAQSKFKNLNDQEKKRYYWDEEAKCWRSKYFTKETQLDDWDKEHYRWDEKTERWFSKHFPKLILGDWTDIQYDEKTGKLKHHVAIRMRAGLTLYIVDDHKWAAAYIKEAQERGEVPRAGNNQIFIDEFPGHRIPKKLADLKDLEKYSLDDWAALIEGVDEKEGSLNYLLAKDGTLKSHLAVDGHLSEGGKENLLWFAPLAGKADFFGTNRERFLESPLRPAKSAIINSDMNSSASPGELLGMLNLVEQDGIIPLIVIFSGHPCKVKVKEGEDPVKKFMDYTQILAKKIPNIFEEESLIRSLEQNASRKHWKLVFKRLTKIESQKSEQVSVLLEQGGEIKNEIHDLIPKVLFEDKNLYLAARYIATFLVYNYGVSDGSSSVKIFVDRDPVFQQKFKKLIDEEIERNLSALHVLANYGKPVIVDVLHSSLIPSISTQKRNKPRQKLKKEYLKQGVALGIQIRKDKIHLVFLENNKEMLKKTLDFKLIEATGESLRETIIELVSQTLQKGAKRNPDVRLDAIGISFPCISRDNKVIRLTVENRWDASEYDALNQLEGKLFENFKQKYQLKKVAILNGGDARGRAVIYQQLNKEGEQTDQATKIVFSVGSGMGYSKIVDGELVKAPNEGGHMIVRSASPDACGVCQSKGCFESKVGADGIRRLAKILEVENIEGEIDIIDILQGAQFINEIIDSREKKYRSATGPVKMIVHTGCQQAILSRYLVSALADMYADLMDQLYDMYKVNQFIFTGEFTEGEVGRFFIKAIKTSLKAKYPKYAEDIVALSKVDPVLGSALGAAQHALMSYGLEQEELQFASDRTTFAFESSI